MANAKIEDYEKFLGYDLSLYNLDNKIKNLRNCVIPETGQYVLNCAMDIITKEDTSQLDIFDMITPPS